MTVYGVWGWARVAREEEVGMRLTAEDSAPSGREDARSVGSEPTRIPRDHFAGCSAHAGE
jgi:hypothetical protein